MSNQQINSIVFFSWLPMSKREADLFCFDYLRQEGFAVHILDLSMLLSVDEQQILSIQHRLDGDFIHKIKSYRDLAEHLVRFRADSIFIDWTMGHANILPSHEKIYRTLRQCNIRYFVIVIGGLPLWNTAGGPQSKTVIFKGKIRRAFSLGISGMLQYVAQQMIKRLRQNDWLYPLPVKVFGTACEELDDFIKRYQLQESQIVYVNYVDYDKYMQYMKQQKLLLRQENNRGICVFLDDAQTHHLDFEILKWPPVDPEIYFGSMRKLFDRIEAETGLEVVIAAHPRSKYEEMPDVFGTRRIIKGKTIDLVADSSMVVAHFSTSINFAVLCDKPILFITTNELIRAGRSIWIEPLAKELDRPLLNIDDKKTWQELSLSYDGWSKKRYGQYISKYIRSRDSDELTMMEVIVAEIRKMERGEHGGSK